MTRYALYGELTAKPGKEEELADFLIGAQAAEALLARAGDLLAKAVDIHQPEVIADKLPV